MKALILSAGQGSRLLPLTMHRPKCLLPLGDETILARQIRELVACGLRDIVVVVGFCAEAVDRELARLRTRTLRLKTLFNPFYGVADNLGSCWLARAEMTSDFMLINGDTVFERDIARRLLAAGGSWPITLTIDRKSHYDDDDMKVVLEGERLLQVGKQLEATHIDGESIGMSAYRSEGVRLFTGMLDRMMRSPQGVKSWYLKAIDSLARTGCVGTLLIEGLRWGEVDFPQDLARVRALFREAAPVPLRPGMIAAQPLPSVA
jgi:choline kinase